MKYIVMLNKRSLKGVSKLGQREQFVLQDLIDAISKSGPEQPSFSHYSKLGPDKYHCHLSYHWVAC